MIEIDMGPTQGVLEEIREERQAQDYKWGQQDHDNGTGSDFDKMQAQCARAACDTAFGNGEGNWRLILNEEFCEALAESDPVKLREELIQCSAVCVAWIEAIDRKQLQDATEVAMKNGEQAIEDATDKDRAARLLTRPH
jgi:hypothetical protein